MKTLRDMCSSPSRGYQVPVRKTQKKVKKLPVKEVMKQQTQEQNQVSAETIELWLKGELSATVKHYIRKYGATLEKKLGLSNDDLENEARFEIWKGLLTYNKSKAKLKTYLNKLVHNRFMTLYKKSSLPKNNMVDDYADVFASEPEAESEMVTADNAESLMEKREVIADVLDHLDGDLELAVLRGLLMGDSLSAMSRENNVATPLVVMVVNKIVKLMKERRDEAA